MFTKNTDTGRCVIIIGIKGLPENLNKRRSKTNTYFSLHSESEITIFNYL